MLTQTSLRDYHRNLFSRFRALKRPAKLNRRYAPKNHTGQKDHTRQKGHTRQKDHTGQKDHTRGAKEAPRNSKEPPEFLPLRPLLF